MGTAIVLFLALAVLTGGALALFSRAAREDVAPASFVVFLMINLLSLVAAVSFAVAGLHK